MEQQPTLDAVCACIRAEAKEGRLCPLSALPALASASAAAGEQGAQFPADAASFDVGRIEASLSAGAPDDIKLMRGARELYYFSELSMTAAYAKHLFRIAERDPVRLIAETARDESQTYPRPTPLHTFYGPPFNMGEAEVESALAELAVSAEYGDISSCAASNGDRFVYSSAHLTPTHAERLAEWIAVEEKENP